MPHKHHQPYDSNPPNDDARRESAYGIRQSAAKLAAQRQHPQHIHNHDEHRYQTQSSHLSCVATFTKGLPHDRETGLLLHSGAFTLFTRAVDTGTAADIRAIPLGPPPTGGRLFRSGMSRSPAVPPRAWESMAAGHTYDLEGPDAQAVTMPPAPALASSEVAFELAQLYWMALLRDTPFAHLESSRLAARAANSLNRMCWPRCTDTPVPHLTHAQRARMAAPRCPNMIFRGTTPGDEHGPHISQFLLTGTAGVAGDVDPALGYVQFGAVRLDQRVRVAAELDYMTTWESWLDVQNAADCRGRDTFVRGEGSYRFITTPRDMATYVHFDALYQAYLNACIILLDLGAPFDPGMPFIDDDRVDKQQGFATFGGPHILTLVTEVATRALKAVRFQKYNIHRRCRPEALGGLIERFHNEPDNPVYDAIRPLYHALDEDLLNRIANLNSHLNENVRDRGWPRAMDYDPSGHSGETLLLPMAYPEGSPMHPSYGAGHATVAGACVTVLKAFFDTNWELPNVFVPTKDGRFLEEVEVDNALTVEGELNKLCSNVSIGRNWAGVHYFSDYFESIRLGEKVALGILEEQKLTYSEQYSMTVPLFDGSVIEI